MDRVRLGRTDLQVSPICFGTWQLGGDWGSFDEREATAAVRRALDLGVNSFDTAQAYGFGASERLLGRALAPELRSGRDEIVIATKGGLRPNGADGVVRDASPGWLRTGAEQSLKALAVDHIDLYALDAAIVRARHSTHIEDSVRAAELRLHDIDLAEIDAIMAGAVSVGGPSPESV